MRAGSLRHRVAIQTPVETNDHGSITLSWSTAATRWAEIRALSGRELAVARQQQSQVTHEVELRSPGVTVTPKNRILYGSRVLQIESIRDPSERGINVIASCVETL
jgi:SPP1 family predicted phage head-tail adaptor